MRARWSNAEIPLASGLQSQVELQTKQDLKSKTAELVSVTKNDEPGPERIPHLTKSPWMRSMKMGLDLEARKSQVVLQAPFAFVFPFLLVRLCLVV